jgi:hypothetical protein
LFSIFELLDRAVKMARPECQQGPRDRDRAFGEGSDGGGESRGDAADDGDGVRGELIEPFLPLETLFGVGARAQHEQRNRSECEQ